MHIQDEKHYTQCLILSSGRQIPVEVMLGVRDADVSAILSPFDMIYLYVVGGYVPAVMRSTILFQLLKDFETRPQAFDIRRSRLLCHLLKMVDSSKLVEANSLTALRLTSAVLRAWLSTMTASRLSIECSISLTLEFEDFLRRNLSSNITSLALLEFESESLVQGCLASKQLLSDAARGCLLSSMISADYARFALCFLNMFSQQSWGSSLSVLFRRGSLDAAICAVFDGYENAVLDASSISSLVALVTSRLHETLSKFDDTSHHEIVAVLSSISRHKLSFERVHRPSMVSLLTNILDCQMKRKQRHTIDAERHLESALKLAIKCYGVDTEFSIEGLESLSNTTLSCLCQLLPRTLRIENERGKNDRVGADGLLSWLREFLSLEGNLSVYHTDEIGSWVDAMIRTCLRYGMGERRSLSLETCCACMQLVESFVKATYREDSRLRHLAPLLDPNMAFETFNMVTAHSRFFVLLKAQTEDDLKLATVLVLSSCLSSHPDVDFDIDTWKSLLVCYNAGLSDLDVSLRFLLHSYGRRANKVSRAIGRKEATFMRSIVLSLLHFLRRSRNTFFCVTYGGAKLSLQRRLDLIGSG
jgi:hypothetical protein